MSTNNKEIRAKELFEKGLNAFNKNNFTEALHYFNLSNKFKSDMTTFDYINRCKIKISEINNSQSNTSSNNQQNKNESENKENSQNETKNENNDNNNEINNNENNNNNDNNNENNNNSENLDEIDIECQKIIKSNDYYEILGLPSTATNEELKQAYKKKAVKFHPDKNRSKFAEEAFKKIGTAYQTLIDPKKKEIYDKYGSDEEFRQKYYEQNQRQYEAEEMDPFDIFEAFFSGGDINEILHRKMQRQRAAQERFNRNINPTVAKFLPLFQLLPLLLMIISYVLPSLLQSKDLYKFEVDVEYPFKRQTKRNKIVYYIGNDFVEKFNNFNDLREEEKKIEEKYLDYLDENCKENTKYSKQLNIKKQYYKKDSYYYKLIQSELNKIDLSVCEKYEKFKDKI